MTDTTMNTGAASLSDEQIEAAPNTITIDRRDLFDFVRGGIKAALEDGKAGEGMVASWYWQEATERAERVLANLGIFNAAIAAGGAQEAMQMLLSKVPIPPNAITFDKGWELLDELQRVALLAASNGEKKNV